ncbi:MAG: S-layer homology domain-containing protein, partial [Oscillospiraceae bacterium]|nr:S-layer homology domain-containing protein [Oscillospiraceae bacterium]
QSALKKGFVPSDIRGDFKAVITRAQFCRMAVMWLEYATDKKIETLLAQKSLKINPSAFSDTQDSYILAAYALGITSGTRAPGTSSPGLFTPNGNFTREQAATMVLNTVRAYGANTTGFPEAKYADIDKASNWAIEGINFCYAKKIMVGTSENPPMFSPQQTYTREQAIITFDNIKQGELA